MLIHMPQLSANVTSAVLREWFKKEGDAVALNDALGGIETDKALMDFDATQAGKLEKILVKAGADVEVGTPIAVLSAEGESVSEVASFLAALAADDAVPAAPRVAAPPPAATIPSPARVLASPLARRLAKESGIDLALLQGSGPAGRIVKRDLEKAPARPAVAQSHTDSAYIEVPHTSMRRTIARRLGESKATIPEFYLKTECHVQRLVELRAEVNRVAPVKVSLNDFIVKAVALALKEVPAMNVSWDDAAMRQYTQSDISVAVSTDTGLITPIVRGAQAKSVTAIGAEIADLAARGRSGRLAAHEYQGGSFAISNLGMFGVDEFTAIINQPQAAILAVGAVKERPLVINGGLAVAPVMNMVLTVDHRVIDGALAATFAAALKRLIENPLSLLL
jgi:pyruvate dehydrogenase E2 component (dihydrolipoamide acetyltransferase)